MKPRPFRGTTSVLVLLTATLGASCASGGREAARTDLPPAADEPTRPDYTEADVDFMRGMIHHHEQALVMTDLIPDRTENATIRQLALRIEISQRDEIARMRRWLEARDEAPPTDRPHEAHMPGMLTDEQIAALAAASGADFDRLFLELMIQHHQGALVMVDALTAAEGAGQEPELFQMISHIDADQRAEIARMRGVANTIHQGGSE